MERQRRSPTRSLPLLSVRKAIVSKEGQSVCSLLGQEPELSLIVCQNSPAPVGCQGVAPHLQHANNEIMRFTGLPLNWGCCAWLGDSFHYLSGNSEAADLHVNSNVFLFLMCLLKWVPCLKLWKRSYHLSTSPMDSVTSEKIQFTVTKMIFFSS